MARQYVHSIIYWTKWSESQLNQLDEFEAMNQMNAIMATNMSDCLDEALLKPGRIDWKIEFWNP
jgi:ATP-dependent 26S proteasome regulatory subunit